MNGQSQELETVADGDLVPLEERGPLAPQADRPLAERVDHTVRLPPDPLYHAVVLAICTGVLGLAFVLSVRQETQVLVPVLGAPLPELCMLRRMTGLGCPGCGMTRSFISLAHGDVLSALHYNPAGLLLFAMMAFQIPFRITQLVRLKAGRPELRLGPWTQGLFAVLGVLMVGQWVLRHLGIGF